MLKGTPVNRLNPNPISVSVTIVSSISHHEVLYNVFKKALKSEFGLLSSMFYSVKLKSNCSGPRIPQRYLIQL